MTGNHAIVYGDGYNPVEYGWINQAKQLKTTI